MNYRPDKVQLMSSSWLTRAYRQLCPFITPKDSLLKPHPYYYWLWKRLATSDTVHVYAVNVTPTHLLLHLSRANHSHMQTLATCFYSAVSVVPVTNCVIHVAMPRLPEFSIVTHCHAELIPREPLFDVSWIHTLPPEEYLDTQWKVHEHGSSLTSNATTTLQPFLR